MNKKLIVYIIILISFISCSSNKTIKKNISISEINNYSITGLQEDKLRQANDLFYKGGFYSAIEIYNSLLESFMASDNQIAVINLILLIAETYIEAMNYEKALETLEIAKNRLNFIIVKTANKDKYTALYMNTLSKLMLYYDKPSFKEIKEGLLNHSLILAKMIKDSNILMKSYINLGQYYMNQKEFDLALENFEKALYLANYTGKKYSYAILCEIIGKIYVEKQDFKKAEKYFITAYNILSNNNYNFSLGRLLITIGDFLIKANNVDLAISFYNRGYEIISSNEETDKNIKDYYLKSTENKLNNLNIKVLNLRLK